MHIFIINLSQSTDRLTQQIEQFSQLTLSFERLPAVGISDIDNRYYRHIQKYGQRLIKQTEVACFLSHKKAWERVIELNKPCVVLEDDAVLVKDFKEILKEINQLNQNIDLINLEVQPRYKVVSKHPKISLVNQNYHLYRLYLEKSGSGGYIIFPSGAQKLLEHSKNHFGLTDAFIYHCPKLLMYQIEPAALLQDVVCSSYNIKTKNSLNSIILTTKNTLSLTPTAYQKIIFKKNRLLTQISLGIRTVLSLKKGIRRQIKVNKDKFI